MENKKSHWEQVYTTKTPEQVSWTQNIPQSSLDLINNCNLGKDASIIDIGGGDSNLVDFLLSEGYTNITVLDISGKAIERAKTRLGKKADKIKWIETDIVDFQPIETYDIWHDRAAFHFLTKPADITSYISLTDEFVNTNLILGTFSNDGPLKCSGLEITQYNEESMAKCFSQSFKIVSSKREDHTTPFDTKQNFLFTAFQKI